jgi:hypothetical protein
MSLASFGLKRLSLLTTTSTTSRTATEKCRSSAFKVGHVEPGRRLRQEGERRSDDLEIHPPTPMKVRAFANKAHQAFASRAGELRSLEDVAVLRAALVVGLKHESGRADDGQAHLRRRRFRPPPIDVGKKVANPRHVPPSEPGESPWVADH